MCDAVDYPRVGCLALVAGMSVLGPGVQVGMGMGMGMLRDAMSHRSTDSPS
jgi:hypothetical protein